MAETAEKTKKKVMVGIDESECSHYALQWALDNLGDTVYTSHLVIFSAQTVSDYGLSYASSYGAAPPDMIIQMEENRRKLILALLAKAKEICSQHGIVAETMTESGDPKEVICDAVEKLNISLLVVGSHSRGAIKRKLLKP